MKAARLVGLRDAWDPSEGTGACLSAPTSESSPRSIAPARRLRRSSTDRGLRELRSLRPTFRQKNVGSLSGCEFGPSRIGEEGGAIRDPLVLAPEFVTPAGASRKVYIRVSGPLSPPRRKPVRLVRIRACRSSPAHALRGGPVCPPRRPARHPPERSAARACGSGCWRQPVGAGFRHGGHAGFAHSPCAVRG